jgi:hypothetical protein
MLWPLTLSGDSWAKLRTCPANYGWGRGWHARSACRGASGLISGWPGRIHVHTGDLFRLIGCVSLPLRRAETQVVEQTINVRRRPRCPRLPQAAVPQDLLDRLALKWVDDPTTPERHPPSVQSQVAGSRNCLENARHRGVEGLEMLVQQTLQTGGLRIEWTVERGRLDRPLLRDRHFRISAIVYRQPPQYPRTSCQPGAAGHVCNWRDSRRLHRTWFYQAGVFRRRTRVSKPSLRRERRSQADEDQVGWEAHS